jgi:molybdopterin converting factor small subunit
MRITLKLFLTFRRYLPPEAQGYACQLDVAADITVEHVLNRFGVPTDDGAVILVNGRTTDLGQVLEHGDALAAFPPMAGG